MTATALPAARLATSVSYGDVASLDGDAGRRQSAFSNRLTSILSSSFADSEVREALKLVDARSSWTADIADVDLKHEAQKEVIEANAKIIDDFSKVAKQLKRVGALMTTLNQTCDDMRKHILAAKQETAPMLEEATSLLAQKQETETKRQLLDAFNKHFLVSDDDLTTLTNSTESVNDHFFVVLNRVKQIHKDCEILLGYENQRLGLELLEQTTRNLDAGYKKLYTWTQREFKGLDLEDPHISGSIRRSLRALSERPALFQNCLDFFAEARQTTLAEAFRAALTDSTIGSAKAIDFSTHDPLRYIGDMLAWVHSTTVSEMEALEGLFISDAEEISRSLSQGRTLAALDNPSSTMDNDTPFDGHAALNSLISRNMALVCQTLTQRISLTVRNLTEPLEIYKANNLLLFYHDMFTKLLNHNSPNPSIPNSNTLLTTLSDLQSSTLHHFETTLTEDFTTSADDTPAADLSPPQTLTDSLTLFVSCISIRGNITLQEFTKLYAMLLSPVLTTCNELADLASDSRATSVCAPATVYRTNYMTLTRDTLHTVVTKHHVELAQEPARSADEQIHQLTQALTQELSETFARRSGLAQLNARLAQVQSDKLAPVAATKALLNADGDGDDGYTLEDLAGQLDSFLAHALADTQDELRKLNDKGIAKGVVDEAVREFVERFEEVVGVLEGVDGEVERGALVNGLRGRAGQGTEDGGEDEEEDEEELPRLREVYVRTVEEVEALLS